MNRFVFALLIICVSLLSGCTYKCEVACWDYETGDWYESWSGVASSPSDAQQKCDDSEEDDYCYCENCDIDL